MLEANEVAEIEVEEIETVEAAEWVFRLFEQEICRC